MSQANAEFIPTRIAILTVSTAAAKRTIPPATGCAMRCTKRDIPSSIRLL